MDTWSREAFSCHPVFPYGNVTGVPCGEVSVPSDYPEGGTNTAAGWPPLYYVYAALVVRLLGVLGVEPLYAARLASCLLWALGAAAIVLLAAKFGAHVSAAASAGLLAGEIPVAAVLGAFVTPHSAQLLLSVILCWTVLHLMQCEDPLSRQEILAGLSLPAIAVLVVPHALVAVTITYIALFSHWGYRLVLRRRIPARWWLVAFGPLLSLAAYEGWNKLVNARTTTFSAKVDLSHVTAGVDPRGNSVAQALIAQWWHFWPNSLVGDSLGFGNYELLIATGVMLLAAGGVGVALLSSQPHPLARSLAVGLMVGAPLTSLAFERTFAFIVPLRYGSSVIGISLLVLALSLPRARGRLLLVMSLLVWLMAFFTHWP